MFRKFILLIKFVLLLATLNASSALAQFPHKPIRLIVPYSAGTATDIVARTIAEPLGSALGQPVIVDNKPGAASAIGTDMAAKASADGYTLLVATSQGVAANPGGLVPSVPYDATKDFSYVSLLGTVSYVLLTSTNLDVETPLALIDYIKTNRGKLNYGSGNMGGIAYMAFLKRAYDLDITHVPYKSTPPALVDLVGGRVQVMMTDIASATPLIRSNRVRAVGIASAQRSPLLPEVPTLAESGMPNVPDMSGWWALAAPTGVPGAIMDRLNQLVVEILQRPEVRSKLLDNGIVPTSSSREQATRHQRDQLESWRKLVKELDLRAS